MRGAGWLATGLFGASLAVGCGGTSKGPASNLSTTSVDLAEAQRQYVMKCAMCHGERGEPVLVTAPDLRTSTLGMAERVALITYGKGTMPPHEAMLDAATIRGIATYIESFRP